MLGPPGKLGDLEVARAGEGVLVLCNAERFAHQVLAGLERAHTEGDVVAGAAQERWRHPMRRLVAATIDACTEHAHHRSARVLAALGDTIALVVRTSRAAHGRDRLPVPLRLLVERAIRARARQRRRQGRLNARVDADMIMAATSKHAETILRQWLERYCPQADEAARMLIRRTARTIRDLGPDEADGPVATLEMAEAISHSACMRGPLDR